MQGLIFRKQVLQNIHNIPETLLQKAELRETPLVVEMRPKLRLRGKRVGLHSPYQYYIFLSSDVDDSKVVEDVHVLPKSISIEDISVGFDTSILVEGHAFYEDTSKVVDAIVESGTPLTIDAYIHDTSESAPKLVELVSLFRFLGIHLSLIRFLGIHMSHF